MPQWDYSRKGNYSITINTNEKGNVFGKISDGKMNLNQFGEIANRYIRTIPNHFPHVKLCAHIVMPDHVHILLEIYKHAKGKTQQCCVSEVNGISPKNDGKRSNIYSETEHCSASPSNDTYSIKKQGTFYHHKPGSIPVIIRSYKSICSREIHKLAKGKHFKWQTSFYDQVIFDEQYLQNTIHYILTNPQTYKKTKPLSCDRG